MSLQARGWRLEWNVFVWGEIIDICGEDLISKHTVAIIVLVSLCMKDIISSRVRSLQARERRTD